VVAPKLEEEEQAAHLPGRWRIALHCAQSLLDGQQFASLHQPQQPDFEVQAGLKRLLHVLEQLQGEMQIPRQVFFAEARCCLPHANLLGRGRSDQLRLDAGHPRDKKIPEVPRELPAEVVQTSTITFEFLHDLQHR
jgi:hypothetical protein